MTGERFIDVDGIRTRYFDKGSGEVLVLFHGSHLGTNDACESALDWELNFDRLAEWFRVIAVDKLGQGHTDNPKRDIIRWPRRLDTLTGFFRRSG
jgi:2-hydroxy-6-oxo-6-(2'-carboxyphenyl)-hexa-2,4-dienoate hydrolase